MSYPTEFIAQNNASRERIAKIAAMEDTVFSIPLEDAWTIGTALAHVAFWDRRAWYIIERWEREGVSPSPNDSEIFNQSLQAFFDALPPRAIAQIAVESAEKLDRKLETLSDALVDYMNQEKPFAPARAAHRNEHLDQIENALRSR